MMKYLFIISLTSFVLYSCKKKEKTLDPVPVIELVNVTPTNIAQFKDSVLVTIKYKDNNGDIGDQSPDEYSLSVKDSRLAVADWYHVQPLAPLGHELKFEGNIQVKINTMFLLGNGKQENSTLSIKLKDRAGHWSNEINTPAITINDTL
jgi:hypothetical protein